MDSKSPSDTFEVIRGQGHAVSSRSMSNVRQIGLSMTYFDHTIYLCPF